MAYNDLSTFRANVVSFLVNDHLMPEEAAKQLVRAENDFIQDEFRSRRGEESFLTANVLVTRTNQP